jgi:hypothetical protein
MSDDFPPLPEESPKAPSRHWELFMAITNLVFVLGRFLFKFIAVIIAFFVALIIAMAWKK